MSESLLSRPASALRQDQSPPQQESHLQGGISLLSGIATAAYAATFSQPNQLPPILQPRAEAQPALSSYAPERHPEHPFDAHYYNLPPLNAHPTPQLPPKSIHHSIQPDETPYQQQEAHSNQSEQQSIKPTFAQDWWTNPHTAAWAGRMNWPTHFGASHFLQSRGCPPIVIDSRAPSEASSEESLGSLPEEPPEHHVSCRCVQSFCLTCRLARSRNNLRTKTNSNCSNCLHDSLSQVPLRGVAPIPAQHFRPVYPHSAPLHHPYYLNWFPQLPSPASSSHSLILYGQQESPVWSGFQNFTLSDHSRPSSVNADRLSPDPSPVTSLSRVGPPCSRESFTNKTGLTPVDRQTHSMDSTHDLLAAASAEDLSQSDTEAGPIRRGRNRARASQVLALDEAPPAVSLNICFTHSQAAKSELLFRILPQKPVS